MIARFRRWWERRQARRGWKVAEHFTPPARVETDSGEWVALWRYRNGKIAGMPASEYDNPTPGRAYPVCEPAYQIPDEQVADL